MISGTLTAYNDTLPRRTPIFPVSRTGGWNDQTFTVAGAVPSCVGDNGARTAGPVCGPALARGLVRPRPVAFPQLCGTGMDDRQT